MFVNVCYKRGNAWKGSRKMNAKRILCLILVAVMLLGLLASAITILVSAEEASTSTETTGTQSGDAQNTVNLDKIVFFVLCVGVPLVMFALILIKVNKGR